MAVDHYATSDSWYSNDLPDLAPGTRELLVNYSKVREDQIEHHISAIRDKAWAVHKYPCIGQWRFLDLSIGLHSLYPEILERLRTGQQVYLDLGCAFAQDIRRLVADGVDSSRCYGSDLQLDFIDLGYELFRDKETLRSEFIAADVFDSESPLQQLEGAVDVINASSFFHLFNWDEQKTIALRVSKLLRPAKDSLLVGRQFGNEVAGETPHRDGSGSRWKHNAESWRNLWIEVGKLTGANFDVNVSSKPAKEASQRSGDIKLEFSVRRT